MDIEATAKKIREAIFDRAEADGHGGNRVLHASSVEEEIAKVLKSIMPAPYTFNYGQACLEVEVQGAHAALGIGQQVRIGGEIMTVTHSTGEEWR